MQSAKFPSNTMCIPGAKLQSSDKTGIKILGMNLRITLEN